MIDFSPLFFEKYHYLNNKL